MMRLTLKGSDIKRLLVALGVLLTGSLLVPSLAFADVNDFTVTDFTADYYLTNVDRQGQMRIVEKIAVDFADFNHGILRAIPESYKGQPLNIHITSVSSASGAPASYTTYGQNGNKVLKIGDPNRTVTGAQEYTIDYTMQNVIGFYGDHDELYWNVNGTQWDQPFTSVISRLHVPAGLRLSAQTPRCFVGGYGSTDNSCIITVDNGVVTASVRDLGPGTTLTFVTGFAKGYFQPASWLDRVRDYAPDALMFAVPLVLIGGAGFLWWLKRGRDARGTGVIIPQYDAPDNLSPLEVGAIAAFKVESRALTATIIDLAIRKYLRIIENDKKGVFGARKTYTLQLLNKDWSQLNAWEEDLMGGLFGALGENETVALADMATKLQTEAKAIQKTVPQSLTERGYFVSNPSRFMAVSAVTVALTGAGILWVVPWVRNNMLITFGTIGGAVVFAAFYHFLAARTSQGVAAEEHIKGLKLYLQVAEKDRIKMLQSPDAPYAPKADEPAHTVELFEKLLPYAVVLGVENEWAKKFEGIYASPPDWYGGNFTAFNAGYLVGSLGGGFSGAMSTSFSPPRSSSGSGFGGGFAGGGGGGGGGGGW